MRHHVSDQLWVSGEILSRQHRRMGHLGVACQAGLSDLSQLDAETADLDLARRCDPDESSVALGQPTHPIAAAIQAAAGAAERSWPRTARPSGPDGSGSSSRQTTTANIELPGNPNRDRLQVRVQHIDLGVPDRATDGNPPGTHRNRIDRVIGAADDGFGRPIFIDYRRVRRMLQPTLCATAVGLSGSPPMTRHFTRSARCSSGMS